MNKLYPIHNISRLRMGTDGEGIRTLVFMNGCPLKCKYCFNKPTWDGSEQPHMMTAEKLYSKICIDRPYLMATNGGITFGGGEPLLYPELINEIRDICEPEMTIYVETSLHVPWDNIALSLASIDKYIVDIKTTDSELYKLYTGEDLNLSLGNLKRILEAKGPDKVEVRIPQIPGLVDKKKQQETQKELRGIGVYRFDLFKYRVVDS